MSLDVSVDEATVDAIDNAVNEKYFTKVWHPKQKKYKYSGLAIIDEINAMSPRSVLDVGCGYNEFKGKINNLYGIDLYNPKADEQVGIMEYVPQGLHDVLICFGSINFGNIEKVFSELHKCVAITEPQRTIVSLELIQVFNMILLKQNGLSFLNGLQNLFSTVPKEVGCLCC